jgi:hypothetical protein
LPPKLAVRVTDSLLVTVGEVKITDVPFVLSSEPPVTVQVIVPPPTCVAPAFTVAVNANLTPDTAGVSDGVMVRVVLWGSQEGEVMYRPRPVLAITIANITMISSLLFFI